MTSHRQHRRSQPSPAYAAQAGWTLGGHRDRVRVDPAVRAGPRGLDRRPSSAIPLVLVTAGIVLLLAAVPLMGVARQCAPKAGRAGARRRTCLPRTRPTDGEGVLGKLQVWMRDPARWRDLLWGLVDITAGFVLSVLALVPLLGFVLVARVPARLRRDPGRRLRHAARLHDHRHVLGVVLRVDRAAAMALAVVVRHAAARPGQGADGRQPAEPGPHRAARASRPGPADLARGVGRLLRGRAAPDRARPARRRAGPAGRAWA